MTQQNDQPIHRKEIVFDRETRDFAAYLDGELAGFAPTYHDAEVLLDNLVYALIGLNRPANEAE